MDADKSRLAQRESSTLSTHQSQDLPAPPGFRRVHFRGRLPHGTSLVQAVLVWVADAEPELAEGVVDDLQAFLAVDGADTTPVPRPDGPARRLPLQPSSAAGGLGSHGVEEQTNDAAILTALAGIADRMARLEQ